MSAGDETIDVCFTMTISLAFLQRTNDFQLGITARSMTRVSEITDIDPLFTDSSDESHSDPSSFWGDGLLQHQVSASSFPYLIPSYANIMTRSFPTRCARDPGGPQIAVSLAL